MYGEVERMHSEYYTYIRKREYFKTINYICLIKDHNNIYIFLLLSGTKLLHSSALSRTGSPFLVGRGPTCSTNFPARYIAISDQESKYTIFEPV